MARSEDANKRQRSAGFIVLRPDGDGDWRVLVLHSSVVKKGRIVAQVWDIPKGHVNREDGEADFEAAVRETQEETQFSPQAVVNNMKWGQASYTVGQKNKDVVLFLTEWDESNPDPEFFENEETGIKEHDDFVWADWQLAYATVYPAMRNGIIWAYSVAHDCTPSEAEARITGGK